MRSTAARFPSTNLIYIFDKKWAAFCASSRCCHCQILFCFRLASLSLKVVPFVLPFWREDLVDDKPNQGESQCNAVGNVVARVVVLPDNLRECKHHLRQRHCERRRQDHQVCTTTSDDVQSFCCWFLAQCITSLLVRIVHGNIKL